jgi:hypothetical protein
MGLGEVRLCDAWAVLGVQVSAGEFPALTPRELGFMDDLWMLIPQMWIEVE